MVGRRAYDLMYRYWAPWDSVGVRDDLRRLVDTGVATPDRHPQAVDLGCGTGANVVYLAERGFQVTGVDFSGVALAKGRKRAVDAGVAGRCRFVEGDLTGTSIPGAEGPFDLLVDFGTLDDLSPAGRRSAAATVERLSRPGSLFLFWCFYGRRADLPRISFVGPSKLAPTIEPGEETDLFGHTFDIEPFALDPNGTGRMACFLLTRR